MIDNLSQAETCVGEGVRVIFSDENGIVVNSVLEPWIDRRLESVCVCVCVCVYVALSDSWWGHCTYMGELIL